MLYLLPSKADDQAAIEDHPVMEQAMSDEQDSAYKANMTADEQLSLWVLGKSIHLGSKGEGKC